MPPAKQPNYRYISYGDGSWALELDKIDKKNEQGVEGWEFKLQPGRDIINQFSLRSKGLIDKFDHAIRWYPKSKVHVLNDSPINGRIFIQTDYMGNDTGFSRSLANYTETIENLQRLIASLRAQNARLTREVRLLMSSTGQYWTEQIEVIKKIKEASATKSAFEGFDPTQNTEQQ